MKYLKEDGRLDIERIDSLPMEEYMNVMGSLTQEQVKKYVSKLPINESHEPMRAIKVDSTFDIGVDADEVINNIRNMCRQ